MTLQREGRGEEGTNYVARECLSCWGVEEEKTEGGRGEKQKRKRGRSSLCGLPVETQGEMKKGGREREKRESAGIPPSPPSSISQDWRCKVIAQAQLKADPRSLVIGPQPSILTSDAHMKRHCFLARYTVYFWVSVTFSQISSSGFDPRDC